MLPLFSEKNHRVDINPRIRGIHIGSAVQADLHISGINADDTRTSARDKEINTWIQLLISHRACNVRGIMIRLVL